MSCAPVFVAGRYQLNVSENSGESVIQCVFALRTPSWYVRYVRFGPATGMFVRLTCTQSSQFALQIGNHDRFCLQPGNPLGAKRSSSRVSDRRTVLTRLVPRTEFK